MKVDTRLDIKLLKADGVVYATAMNHNQVDSLMSLYASEFPDEPELTMSVTDAISLAKAKAAEDIEEGLANRNITDRDRLNYTTNTTLAAMSLLVIISDLFVEGVANGEEPSDKLKELIAATDKVREMTTSSSSVHNVLGMDSVLEKSTTLAMESGAEVAAVLTRGSDT